MKKLIKWVIIGVVGIVLLCIAVAIIMPDRDSEPPDQVVVSNTVCKRRRLLEWEASLKDNGQLVQDLGPVPDGRRPFLGDVPVDEIKQLASRLG